MKESAVKRHKIFTILLSYTILVLSMTISVSAATPQESQNSATYDRTVGGTQVFHLKDQYGEESIVTVTELPSGSRVANGKYKVEYTKNLYWNAGFTISVSSNRIMSAYGEYATPYLGSITNATLIVDHSKQATYQFNFNLLSTQQTGVRCVLDGDNIQVYCL